MIFSYVRYELAPTATIPSGEVFRPRIPIKIVGPDRALQVFGLLDTGADHVFLSASIANQLGIESAEESEIAHGAGGHDIDVWPSKVEIEVSDGVQTFRWPAEVGFLVSDDDTPIAFLGNVGFLEYFTAIFDYVGKTVELLPRPNIDR